MVVVVVVVMVGTQVFFLHLVAVSRCPLVGESRSGGGFRGLHHVWGAENVSFGYITLRRMFYA